MCSGHNFGWTQKMHIRWLFKAQPHVLPISHTQENGSTLEKHQVQELYPTDLYPTHSLVAWNSHKWNILNPAPVAGCVHVRTRHLTLEQCREVERGYGITGEVRSPITSFR